MSSFLSQIIQRSIQPSTVVTPQLGARYRSNPKDLYTSDNQNTLDSTTNAPATDIPDTDIYTGVDTIHSNRKKDPLVSNLSYENVSENNKMDSMGGVVNVDPETQSDAVGEDTVSNTSSYTSSSHALTTRTVSKPSKPRLDVPVANDLDRNEEIYSIDSREQINTQKIQPSIDRNSKIVPNNTVKSRIQEKENQGEINKNTPEQTNELANENYNVTLKDNNIDNLVPPIIINPQTNKNLETIRSGVSNKEVPGQQVSQQEYGGQISFSRNNNDQPFPKQTFVQQENPEVNINIERIEITAVKEMQEYQSRPPAQSTKRPMMSLDDYLKQRSNVQR